MRKPGRIGLLVGVAFAVVALMGVVAYAIPDCWEICDGGGCYFACSADGGCAGYAPVCISGQGYCQYTCLDGAVYNSICNLNCPTGGGGSPVFRKPNIQDAQPPS
jgi:hypothetical protein